MNDTENTLNEMEDWEETMRLMEVEKNLINASRKKDLQKKTPEEEYEEDLRLFEERRREVVKIFELAAKEAAHVTVGALRFSPRNMLDVKAKAIHLQAANSILEKTAFAAKKEDKKEIEFESLNIINGEYQDLDSI